MENKENQQQIRLNKLKKIRELGIDPYPYSYQISHTIPEIYKKSEELIKSQENISIAGRLLAVRGKGKASFANMQAQHTRIQIYLRQDSLGKSIFEIFKLCE